MEIIQKTICLEQFKCRTDTMAVKDIDGNDSTSWGNIPMDVVMPESDGSLTPRSFFLDRLPLTEKDGMGERTSLRYKNMLLAYLHLRNLIKNCQFYKLCHRSSGYKWTLDGEMNENVWETFLNSAITFEISSAPTTDILTETTVTDSGHKYGDIICAISDPEFREWYLNTFTARTYPTTKVIGNSSERYDEWFIKFVEDLRQGKVTPSISESYIPIPIYLEEEFDSMGSFDAAVETWIAGKKYYVGEYVLYDGSSYKLVKGDKSDSIEISKGAYDAFNANKAYSERLSTESESGVTHYYLARPYYQGYFNSSTMLTEFDDSTKSHWELTAYDGEDDESKDPITGVVISYLCEFARKKKSTDDDGNVLPFIIHYDTFGNTGSSKYIETELLYTTKIAATREINEVEHQDILSEITFYSDDVPSGLTISITGSSVDITASYIEANVGTEGTVKFVYYKNARLISGVINGGIKYEETYEYSIELFKGESSLTYSYAKETSAGSGTYIDASVTIENPLYKYIALTAVNTVAMSSELEEKLSDETVEKYGTDAIFSQFEYSREQANNDWVETVPYFKDEALLGIEGRRDRISTYVTRGTSAAFERHNILGEVNTLDDLENYRNDYFGIRDKSYI